MKDLTLVVVGKDWREIREFDMTHVGPGTLVLVANQESRSLAAIGNYYADRVQTPVLGLVHADCLFGPGALASFTQTAMEGSVCGIAGVSMGCKYRWSFESSPGAVSTLDSCSVFFRPDSGLRFDEKTFDSYHCHVADLCLAAHARGIPVVVPSADASHRGTAWRNNRDHWMPQYHIYRARLGAKWKGTDFVTT